MESPISYRFMQAGEEGAVCDLVIRVFDEFIAPEYSPEGVQEFLSYIKPNLLWNRSRANHFVLVAVAQGEVVGVIEVRDYDHISLFFVDKEFQQRGIGKELMGRSLGICRNRKSDVSQISVHSSLYAVPVYEKLGFLPSGPRQITNGMIFVPMVLELSDSQEP